MTVIEGSFGTIAWNYSYTCEYKPEGRDIIVECSMDDWMPTTWDPPGKDDIPGLLGAQYIDGPNGEGILIAFDFRSQLTPPIVDDLAQEEIEEMLNEIYAF